MVYPRAAGIITLEEKSGQKFTTLVKQYRAGIGSDSLEFPAGKAKPGEPIEECAKRELREETGLIAETMEKLISYHPAIGFCTEVLTLFTATGLTRTSTNFDDDEDIEIVEVSLTQLQAMIESEEITDSKTILGYSFLQQTMFR